MRRNTMLLGLTLAALLAGCAENENRSGDASTGGGAAAAGSDYLLASEPAGALGVVEARETIQDGKEITVVGRVGGDPDPFVKGTAAFTIVDLSLKPCPADEGCPTPWDYCCDLNKLRSHKAMVKVVDEQDSLVTVDAKELLGVEPLATLVVRGRAKRDEAGNLTVLADGVYRRQ
jgi:hypothetical protein